MSDSTAAPDGQDPDYDPDLGWQAAHEDDLSFVGFAGLEVVGLSGYDVNADPIVHVGLIITMAHGAKHRYAMPGSMGPTVAELLLDLHGRMGEEGAFPEVLRPGIDQHVLLRQRRFSKHAFGPGDRQAGIVEHIGKELEEIQTADADDVLGEWIDVAMLALDGAWRSGATPHQILLAYQDKLARNEQRTWPDWRTAGPGAIEHDRSGE